MSVAKRYAYTIKSPLLQFSTVYVHVYVKVGTIADVDLTVIIHCKTFLVVKLVNKSSPAALKT